MSVKKEKKKKSTREKVILIMQILFALVFVVSVSVILYERVLLPSEVDSGFATIEEELEEFINADVDSLVTSEDTNESSVSTESTADNKETNTALMKNRDNLPAALKKLQNKYPDLVGWIKIDNTIVNFPVMQSAKDKPDYYLRRDYLGNYSKYGSIYVDSESDLESDLQILYGHSMSDKRMFYCLLDLADTENLKKSPVVQFDTVDGTADYKIVSIFKTNTRYSHGMPFNYLKYEFKSTEDKMQFIYDCMLRSVVDTGVDIDDEDEFILLSTCSYEFEDFRTGVLCRKVRENEESTVDTSLIKENEAPLYPDVWYQTYGGQRPKMPSSFEDAVKENSVDWYIGDLYR